MIPSFVGTLTIGQVEQVFMLGSINDKMPAYYEEKWSFFIKNIKEKQLFSNLEAYYQAI